MEELQEQKAADLDRAVRESFGFDGFRPGQREVIERLMDGKSALAVFPTGAGKSLCYQLPSLLLDGLTLVVSPLIALMKDQIDALRARGIPASRLDSSLSPGEYREVMGELRQRRLRLLYVSPERFNNERFREALLGARVALFAVDEAHCMSEWGHNFRPDYLKLAQFARQFRAERVLALTATATRRVMEDIGRVFDIEPEGRIATGFYRPNLTLLATPASPEERDGLLMARLRERQPGPTIVYVTQQKTSEQLAERLAQAGFAARAYHAGMKDDQRTAVQEAFLASDRAVIVATIAFGMGIDKSDIRYVYHYNLPKSLENYSQEIGRAGRDGAPSTCEMLVAPADLNVLENFAYGDVPTFTAVRELVEHVFAQPAAMDVSYYELSSLYDIRILVVRTLLTYLELLGYLEAGTPVYGTYKFRPLLAIREILARFDEPRRRFLDETLAQAQRGRVWYSLDPERAAAATRSPRERVVRALDYLNEQGWVELQAENTRYRYQRLKPCDDVDALAERLHRRLVEQQQRDLARLQQVLELAGHDGCQYARLCDYFGQALAEPCGHCSWCLNGSRPIAVPARPAAMFDPELLARLDQLRRERPGVLDDPVSAARLLCGITAPRLTRARLSSHPLFGAASHVPFPDLVARLESA